MFGTFLKNLLPPSDCRGLLPIPKETYNLNLSAINLSIWSFRTPTSICCTIHLYNPDLLPSPQLDMKPNESGKNQN